MSDAAHDDPADVVVIGAGMAGLRIVHELRRLGLAIRGFEAGSDVGGTWYWNAYPGARTDSEAWGYGLFFDEDLAAGWDWPERNPNQQQVLDYLKYVATRLDIRKNYEFNQFVRAARFDDDTSRWTVELADGRSCSATFLVTACGLLSSPIMPDIKGSQSFRGLAIHSGRWPKDEVDFAGKRVGIIGAGATGVQLLPVIAQVAGHVTMFQRTPNFVMPARNAPLVRHDHERIRRHFRKTKQQIREHVFAIPVEPNSRSFSDVTTKEARRILEAKWESGGFQFVFESFNDFLVNPECNEFIADFIREKIRTIVNDPRTAEALCPRYPVFSKRPPLGHGYYEAYNRENVSLVDVSVHQVDEIGANGIRIGDEEYPLDIIIFATGFDAGTGALTDMDIVGIDGRSLRYKWADGPLTYMGICVDGFPNMFIIDGPQTPVSNIPPAIEAECEWVAGVLEKARSAKLDRIEVLPSATRAWKATVDAAVKGTILENASDVRSYYLGANVAGKAHVIQFYLGGFGDFVDRLEKSAAAGFPELAFSAAPTSAMEGASFRSA